MSLKSGQQGQKMVFGTRYPSDFLYVKNLQLRSDSLNNRFIRSIGEITLGVVRIIILPDRLDDLRCTGFPCMGFHFLSGFLSKAFSPLPIR